MPQTQYEQSLRSLIKSPDPFLAARLIIPNYVRIYSEIHVAADDYLSSNSSHRKAKRYLKYKCEYKNAEKVLSYNVVL